MFGVESESADEYKSEEETVTVGTSEKVVACSNWVSHVTENWSLYSSGGCAADVGSNLAGL